MNGSGFLAISLPFFLVGAAKANDPHRIFPHGKNNDVRFAVDAINQRLVSDFAIVSSCVPADDGTCPIERRDVSE
jgi:adenine deaminase